MGDVGAVLPRLLMNLLLVGNVALPRSDLDLARVDRFVADQMRAGRVPGLALAITHGDEVVYVKGYGTDARGNPITPRTLFPIGSLSKSFTALAVLRLAGAGAVDLDAPVVSYLPAFGLAAAGAADRITVRHLLNQTSGLSDAGFREPRGALPAGPAERVASLAGARPVSEPGEEFHYFNPNYEVLGRLIEVVSGESLSDYLGIHVFAPLGMDSTFAVINSAELAAVSDDIARGHLLAFGLPVGAGEESGYLGGSGGVVSNAEDMARYLTALASGGAPGVPASVLGPLLTPPPGSDYAMGWFERDRDGTRLLEHNGVLSTFTAQAVLLPDSGYGVAVLYDVHSLAQDLLAFPRIEQGLVALLRGEEPTSGGFDVRHWGLVFATLALLGAALGVRALLRFPAWTSWAPGVGAWRHWLGIVFGLLPLGVALAMPAIVLRTSGRSFGSLTLFRSMIGVMTWLWVVGALGAANGLLRLGWLLRRG